MGGTAIGGYEPLPTPEAPYLPKMVDRNYCLVLDLDETLVHYFEVGNEGTFLVRPGCDQFLKEMAEIYEIVIFTAAMQDVSSFSFYLELNFILIYYYSMLTGSLTKLTKKKESNIDFTGSTHFLTATSLLKIYQDWAETFPKQ